MQGIYQSGAGDDSGSVLVVVHHRDVKFFFQTAFDFETFGSFDVFQIDTAESRSDCFYGSDEFLRVFFVHFDIEHVDSCVDFEKQTFAFHHRFAAQCAYVTQSEYGCTVRNNSYQVAFGCVFVSVLRILLYFEARLCHAGRVCK